MDIQVQVDNNLNSNEYSILFSRYKAEKYYMCASCVNNIV